MPEAAGAEFWKDLKPIDPVFKPHALRDLYVAAAASDDDERLYAPFTDTVSSRPLWISPARNMWCDIVQRPLIWLDDQGASIGHFDVHDYIALCESHYEKVGLGAERVQSLLR